MEYPDTPSGGCTEQFITPGTEAFIRIIPDTLQTESSVASYSTEKVGSYKVVSFQITKSLYPLLRDNAYLKTI